MCPYAWEVSPTNNVFSFYFPKRARGDEKTSDAQAYCWSVAGAAPMATEVYLLNTTPRRVCAIRDTLLFTSHAILARNGGFSWQKPKQSLLQDDPPADLPNISVFALQYIT